jgi:histidine triad (HIT) family protein
VSKTCVFCDEEEAGENTFAETDLWRARWDLYPVTPGHVEVTPKRHVQYVEQLTEDELGQMMRFARDVMQIIRTTDLTALYETLLPDADDRNRGLQQAALKNIEQRGGVPDAFNYGLNDGPPAGQSVPHLHLHIMPRWVGDIENPRGGVRNLFRHDEYKNL